MLIDAAHPEETRVVVLSGTRLEEFDFESSTKKQVKGNIYLAKVTRVEPSLQAAFVDYGGNRHGFLAFSEIHPDYYRIPVSDRASDEPDAPSTEIPVDLPDSVSGNAPANGSLVSDDIPEEIPCEFPELEEADEPNAIAAALPEAVSVPDEDNTPPEAEDEVPATDEPTAGAASGEVNDVEMAAPIESVVSTDRFFESTEPAPTEEVETLDDEEAEEADEAGERRRRSHSMRHYKIQEVVKRRQIMLVQVAKEERGNKGAALTTYLSLAGRYCVLMPNTGRGGGVSRKITSISDRRRLKEILEDLGIPEGMGVIVRTAGSERSKAEIKRDYEYLMRLWSEIRDLTLKSTAPALIYEEGNLIKRSIRDLYARDIDEVVVEGDEGYRTAKTFMRMLMPSHAKRVQHYRDPQIGLFHRNQVESQIDAVHSPVAQLRSGGYIVINQTEALVSIDVNSGRATRERNIEETALKTNLEASDEIARQLRLRDLAGLIVIDFIDMEEYRHNSAVERRLKEALKNDRARIQVGRISAFGLMEMSRQRMRPSLAEASTQPCPHCGGAGFIRSTESTALHVLRAIEEEGARGRSAEICVYVPTGVALYILNQKRESLAQIEARYGLRVTLGRDDTLIPPNFRLERLRAYAAGEAPAPRLVTPPPIEDIEEDDDQDEDVADALNEAAESDEPRSQERGGDDDEERGPRRPRRRRRGRRGEERREPRQTDRAAPAAAEEGEPPKAAAEAPEREGDAERRRRRRGRRGGRWRNRENGVGEGGPESPGEVGEEAVAELVEAAIESGEIPPVEAGYEEPVAEMAAEAVAYIPPAAAGYAESAPARIETKADAAEELVEAAIESAEIPPVEELAAKPERVLETASAGNAPNAEPEPALQGGHGTHQAPEGVDVHAVTEKPEAPRRGWWNRLIQ
ncbi:MAG TPA: Rne/Rng family ribonuclease [Stellaceae bacterium]|nr:Rne/Rng family ribonuclease [Stellaceae bacterium]